MKTAKIVLLLVLVAHSRISVAQVAVHDPVNYTALAKILMETYKRYQQLQQMISSAENQQQLLSAVHSGLENSMGLLVALPIEDNAILEDIGSFSKSYAKIKDIYGEVPYSQLAGMHNLHDNTVAESILMISNAKKYAETQEKNAKIFRKQARTASPKGASRMAVEGNAMILDGLSQLVRLQSQTLKTQSERLALATHHSKNKTISHQKVGSELKNAFKNIKIGSSLPRF